MTHSFSTINPRDHCTQQASARLSLRTNPNNPDHHLWNNNGTWYVHYTVAEPGLSGVRRRESLKTHDRQLARRRRDQVLVRMGFRVSGQNMA